MVLSVFKLDCENLWNDRTNVYHWYPFVAALLGTVIDLFLVPMSIWSIQRPELDAIVFLGLMPLLLAVLIVWFASKVAFSCGCIEPSPYYHQNWSWATCK